MGSVHRCFFLLCFLFVAAAAVFTAAEAGNKVQLALYYESLCPFCSRFIVNHLGKIFNDGLISITDLHLVPYGNARLGSNGSISCQHGPYECLLNTVETCAISAWPDVQQHFNFIHCVERFTMERKYMEWESCFQKTGLASEAVSDCYNSGYGEELELQYASETDALQPPHTYVPWVLVNGQPLYDDYENFEAYICKAYEGELPKACEGLTLTSTEEIKVNRAGGGCRANEMIRSSATRKKLDLKTDMLI